MQSVQPLSLGALLQTVRQEQGLSLSALAARAGVHKSTVSRWERSLSLPFAHELTQTLNALGLPLARRRAFAACLDARRVVQVTVAEPGTASAPVSSGELLRALRARSGRTQAHAAQAANVSRSLIARWERGDCWPDSQNLHQLCLLYGASEAETVFFTTRAWRHLDPLPDDKDALDAVILHLENHDGSTTRSAVYLALAGRYRTLYRAGKISEADANDVYGNYGYYLSWRLNQKENGGAIVAPTLATVKRTRGRLTHGQQEAVAATVGYFCAQGRAREALSLLDETTSRTDQRNQSQWLDLFAQVAEAEKDIDGATAFYRKSLTVEQSDRERNARRVLFVTMLCRHERYAEALPYLKPLERAETRTIFHATNLLNHAVALAGVGENGAAQGYQAQADDLIAKHGFDALARQSAELTARRERPGDPPARPRGR